MGPPGSGKGTQAQTIAARCEIPAISTGEIFRAHVRAGTPLGATAKSYLESGEYVPDSVTNAMVRDRLSEDDCLRGFLLDGYPRTLAQVDALDRILHEKGRRLDAVVVLDVDGDLLVDRLVRRAALEGRSDDTEDVIRRRQKLYDDETAPLLTEYGRRRLLRRVDGSGGVEEVAGRILEALGLDH